MTYIIALLILWPSAHAKGPKGWVPLTDNQRKTCDIDSHCFITQSKDKTKHQIFFKVNKKNKMFWLKQVKIMNTKNKKSMNYSKLDNFQGLFPGERYQLFAIDISGDGYSDLALEASRSLKLGPFYFYFIYNPKTKTYVLNEEQLPELFSSSKGKVRSAVNSEEYKVNSKFQLVRTN